MKNKNKSALKVTLDELLNVLSYYANEKNYIININRPGDYSNIELDFGSKARKILKKLVKEELNRAGIENNL